MRSLSSVVAHFAHPGIGGRAVGNTTEADRHGGDGGDENGGAGSDCACAWLDSSGSERGCSNVRDIVFGICWNANKRKIKGITDWGYAAKSARLPRGSR